MRFLADESCDFAVVTALRGGGHDVTAVVETNAGAQDEIVLALARADARVLLTEDKDFGLLAYAIVRETAGVILIRFPAGARRSLGQAVVDIVATLGDRIIGASPYSNRGTLGSHGPTSRSNRTSPGDVAAGLVLGGREVFTDAFDRPGAGARITPTHQRCRYPGLSAPQYQIG